MKPKAKVEGKEYDARFNKEDISQLSNAHCSPRIANRYDERFNGHEIANLFTLECMPKKVNAYDKRFSAEEISLFCWTGFPPNRVNKYDIKYTGYEIYNGIKGYERLEYRPGYKPKRKRFSYYDIQALIREGCSLEEAHKYDKRFYCGDVISLIKEGCSPEEVNKYDKIFYAGDIISLIKEGCSPEEVNKYDKRFDAEPIMRLVKAGCSPEEANKYGKRLDENDIRILFKAKCSPEEANKYDKRFDAEEVLDFVLEGGQPPEIVNEYDPLFNAEEISSLIQLDCLAETANDYLDKGFGINNIIDLFQSKKEDKISKLPSFIRSLESDEDYSRFDLADCCELHEAGCSLEEIKEYDPRFNGLEIVVLYRMGLKPDKISADKQERLFEFFRKNDELFHKVTRLSQKEKTFKRFSFLGTGVSGVVFLKENKAYKFSEKIDEEYILLKKIQGFHKGNSKNIIKIKDESLDNIILELEYIQGDSLENVLQRKSSKINPDSRVILRKPIILPKNKVLKYASDIMNGLIEMRQAGIFYHRDIRPANIMIDEENNKAVIIDFGIATTDRYESPQNNRRYGGINDLVSLGQIIYKMVTGEHIFAESKSMEGTIHAQKIKDYRGKVYKDKTGKLLEKHIKQVDDEIQDEQLRTLIKSCLKAKNYHYKKIQRMFKDFDA